jgi:hypothetical protein
MFWTRDKGLTNRMLRGGPLTPRFVKIWMTPFEEPEAEEGRRRRPLDHLDPVDIPRADEIQRTRGDVRTGRNRDDRAIERSFAALTYHLVWWSIGIGRAPEGLSRHMAATKTERAWLRHATTGSKKAFGSSPKKGRVG